MNAIQLLRTMHADSKVRFKIILGADDPAAAAQQWEALQPLLTLHEEVEDQLLYTPLQTEMPAGTPLGDWELVHQNDVALVQQLVQASNQLQPGTPEWLMCIGKIMDALQKHITDEEGQIFPRIEQVWGPDRLDSAGQQMQKLVDAQAATPRKPARQRKS